MKAGRGVLTFGAALVTVCVLAGSQAWGAPPRFSPGGNYFLPSPSADAAVGDLNRDGRSDLLVASDTGETSVLLARDGGRLRAPLSLPVTGTGGVAIGELNSDANPDVVRVSTDFYETDVRGRLNVLFGDGEGRFPSRTVRQVDCCPHAVAVGDFSRDDRSDLVISTGQVLLGDGSGGFTARREPVDPRHIYGEEAVVADLNRDSNIDLISHGEGDDTGTVTVLLGNGRGGFFILRTLFPCCPDRDLDAFALGRFDSDRWPDLAVVASDVGENSYRGRVLLGIGRERVRPAGTFGLGRHPPGTILEWGLAAADFDGDGRQDLAVAGADSGSRSISVRVLRGRGRGKFAQARTVARWPGYRADHTADPLRVAFFNRDRRPDVAVSRAALGSSAGIVSVLLNRTR